MKSRDCALFLSILGAAFFAPACHSVDVPDWPYVTAAEDSGPSDDGATSDGASTDGADDAAGGGGMSSMTPPLACDGALCDTTNYTACNFAGNPTESRSARPISGLLVIAGMAFARSRPRRRMERTP